MLKFIKSAADIKDYPDSDKEILLVGRSNVGKSSFINKLYNQKIAYVGKRPGKTRLLNFFDAGFYTLVDAPGYGFARRSGDEQLGYQKMMNDYFLTRTQLKLVILLVDIRRISEDDQEMLAFLNYYKIDYFVIATKLDKLNRNELNKRTAALYNELNIVSDQLILSNPKDSDYKIIKEQIENKLI